MKQPVPVPLVLTILVALGSNSATFAAQPQDDALRQLKLEQIAGVLQPSDTRFEILAYEGQKLSADEAAKLEEKLASTPNDLLARTQLLGYYLREENLKAPRQTSSLPVGVTFFGSSSIARNQMRWRFLTR